MMMPKGIYGDPFSQSDGYYFAQNMQYAHKVGTIEAMRHAGAMFTVRPLIKDKPS